MAEQTLTSWNEGTTKQAILAFVDEVTTEGPNYVPVADRFTTFDNDGTLWVEQPTPPQFDFVFAHWAEEIKQDPSLATQQPYKPLVDKDPPNGRGCRQPT